MWKFWQILLCLQVIGLHASETSDSLALVDPLVHVNSPEIPLDFVDRTSLIQGVKPLEDTAAPTERPSETPTFTPTATPSVMPSFMPTAGPTFMPTAGPTFMPSAVPTFAPSHTPTRLPTTSTAPSFAPSKQSLPIITFTSTLTLGGVTTSTLDDDTAAQLSVSAATCTSMSLPTSDCSYLSSNIAPTAAPTSLRRKLVTETYTLVANVQTSTTVPSGTGATTYGSTLTTTLASAVTGGTFTSNLVSASNTYGSGATANATATAVTSTTPTTTAVEDDDDDDDEVLSDGAIAGIVIGGVVFIAIVVFLLYYCCCRTFDEYVPSNAIVTRPTQNAKYTEQTAIVERSKQDIVIAL